MSTESAKLADYDEQELIARLRARDLEALGELYRRLGSAMTVLARSMMGGKEEAEDVVEEALMRIHAAAPGFRGERGIRTWSLRIVANLCRDHLRRRKVRAEVPDGESALETAGLAFDPVGEWDASLDQRAVMEALERALARLTDEAREVLTLRHRAGLSYGEIAEIVGVPEGTVKSRLSRAHESLRGFLGKTLE